MCGGKLPQYASSSSAPCASIVRYRSLAVARRSCWSDAESVMGPWSSAEGAPPVFVRASGLPELFPLLRPADPFRGDASCSVLGSPEVAVDCAPVGGGLVGAAAPEIVVCLLARAGRGLTGLFSFHPFVLPVIACERLLSEVKTQEARRGAKPGRWSCEVDRGTTTAFGIHNRNTRLSGAHGRADVSQETFAFRNLQYSTNKKIS
jgi:hypothetical protein